MERFDFTLPNLYLNFGENTWQKVAIAGGVTLTLYGIYKYLYRSNIKMEDIHSKGVFITGCDSGIGKGLAKWLDAKGCPVFAGCLTIEGADKLKNECSNRLQTVIIDIRSSESIDKAYEYVGSNLSKDIQLWGIVNNAAIKSKMGPLEFISRSDNLEVMQVNYFGHVDVTRTFLPLLKRSHGRVINIASVSVDLNGPYWITYAASKCALLGFSECLRKEKLPWGIKVSTVLPGLFKTDMVIYDKISSIHYKYWESQSSNIKSTYGNDYIQEFLKLVKENDDSAPSDLSSVIKSIHHALFSEHPKAIYRPDTFSKVPYILNWLPGNLLEKVILRKMDPMISTVKMQ